MAAVRQTGPRSPALILGSYDVPGSPQPVTIPLQESLKHWHVIGTSGSGKSRFLAALFLLLLKCGVSVSLIDPHGDLADLIVNHLVATGFYTQPYACERVRVFDIPRAAQQQRFVPFNVLVQSYEVHAVARNMVEVCKRAWQSLSHGAAPLLETTLLHSVVVLAENNLPLTEMTRLLTDKPYRDQLLLPVTDPAIVQFFHDRYDQWGRNPSTMIESTLRRVSLLTFSPALRFSLGQRENALPFRTFLDQGVSVVYNLGGLDEETQRFFGCLITVGYEVAALSRADMPQAARSPHMLILDEYSMFSATSEAALSRMLSLTRKYGLFLTMAHQTWSQTSTRLRGAMQNVGYEVIFRLGQQDADSAASLLCRVDPYAIKQEANGNARPAYYSATEQRLAWEQAITDLSPRCAFLRRPNGTVAKMRTVSVPDLPGDPALVRRVRDEYLRRYFRSQPSMEQTQGAQEPVAALPTTTRMRRLTEEDRDDWY